jgi:hypothetical protein
MNKTSLLAIAFLWAVAFPLQATARTKPKPKHQNPQVLKQPEVFRLSPWRIEASSFDASEPEIKKFRVKNRPEILQSLGQAQGSEFVGDRQIERVLSGLKKPQRVAKGKAAKKPTYRPRLIARHPKLHPKPLIVPAPAPQTIPTSLREVAVTEQMTTSPTKSSIKNPRRRPLARRFKPHPKPATQTPEDSTAPIPVLSLAPMRVRSNIEPPPPISLSEQAITGIDVAIARKFIEPESAFTLRLRAAARLLATQSIFDVSNQTGIQPNVLQRIVDLGYKANQGTYATTPSTANQQTPFLPNTEGTNTQPAQAARYVENAPQSRSTRYPGRRHSDKHHSNLWGD